jgi:hypothetical protein
MVLVVMAAALPAGAQVITKVAVVNPVAAGSPPIIAPAPLAEASPAMVDRTHLYRSIPKALLGAQYVMVDNDDKASATYELHVTIGQPGMLYLFLDNRLGTNTGGQANVPNLTAAAMTWVTTLGFVDTGMDVGLDENATGTIANWYSVFSKQVTPGEIVLKAQNDTSTGGPGTRNMYAVAAVATGPAIKATKPTPADKATDIPRDVALRWTAGADAQKHDVYLGTDLADVNNASVTKPLSMLVSAGQTGTTCAPLSLLQYGKTYYWRVDEVGTSTVTKGDVWSFTVEPYAYPLKNVTATASSAQVGMGPENTVNGSGLNSADQHSTEPKDMWLSTGTQPNWIQFAFDKAYKLSEMWVWNSNQQIETFIGFGAKNVKVEYSTDGSTWTQLQGVPQFAQATGAATYTSNTTVNFGGVFAKYVKLTINSQWGMVPQCGLSEVRFFYVPVQARSPVPATGATGVNLDATLTWRPGREAASHKVYLGTDQQAVTSGAAPVSTAAGDSFSPASLQFGTTYYWKVNEVNDAATTKSWEGDVWSFTTQPYTVVDDFESYNDTDNRIYDTWIDGMTDGKSNSVVGYLQAPFAEQTILHGGKQSMPVEYNNIKTPYFSETEQTFAPVQNWTVSGANTLVLYFQGRAPGFLQQASGTILMGSRGTDIWGTADQFRYAFKRLTGNGAIVAKVESLVVTDPWAKCGVMIRESLAAGSRYATVFVTPGNGVRFQARAMTDTAAIADDTVITPEQTALKTPVWVKIERVGNVFNGYYSTDGVKWTAMSWNPQTISMAASSVYIGLAVTSHNATVSTSAQFSNVSMTGGVSGSWDSQAIGVAQPSNDAASLYVAVQDSAGKIKVVTHPDPAATTATTWQEWRIPLSSLTGVNLAGVKSLYIGVGDRTNPKAGGAGMLYIDDIGFGRPAGQ